MNMKLSTKLVGGFVAVAVICAIVGVIGVMNINSLVTADTRLYENMTVPLSNLQKVSVSFQRVRIGARDLVMAKTPAEIEKAGSNITDESKIISENSDAFEKLIITDEMRQAYAKFQETRVPFRKSLAEMTELAKAGRQDEAYVILKGEALRAAEAERQALDAMVELMVKEAQQTANSNAAAGSSASALMITFTVGGFAFALIGGFWLARSITRALNAVVESLNAGADQVAAGAEETSSSSQNVAEAGSEMASSLEETSSSIEEMTSMVQQNADHAGQANQMMKENSATVELANTAMQQMQASMHEIKSNSENISKIIKVIEEISFQTNLLALNAAVEAARAGEHGKGFAVVAEEVRNLAQRAATAARDTGGLIETAVTKVNEGLGKVNGVADGLQAITSNAQKVANLVEEIANASREQAQGINQINAAVGEMDKVTQSVAANAEESASAAEEMASQAVAVRETVQTLVALVEGKAMEVSAATLNPAPRAKAKPAAAKAKRPQPAAKRPSPKEVIPLDDENFKEF
ncbi:MAG TPA: methyl-accepting chemotaxis protein [bacterium]|nr:methyl-accepting chemotaxis protein [bacterium]